MAADLWLILSAFMTSVFTLRKDSRAIPWGIALGLAMLLFGLYALTCDLNTGLLLSFATDELFGTAVTLYDISGDFVHALQLK